jgi:hypothetical protein
VNRVRRLYKQVREAGNVVPERCIWAVAPEIMAVRSRLRGVSGLWSARFPVGLALRGYDTNKKVEP